MLTYLRLRLRLRCLGATREGRGHSVGPYLNAPRLRRVLGMGLVERFCPYGEPRCEGDRTGRARPEALCALAACCPYGALIATAHGERPKLAFHVGALRAGEERAEAELTLYGEGWRQYAWVLATAARVLEGGLGDRRESWVVEGVDKVEPTGERRKLCGRDLARLEAGLAPDALGLGVEPFLTARPVAVDFLSPTRLVDDGEMVRRGALRFEVLVARILDRCAGLYGETASELLAPAIRQAVLEAAREVEILADDTRWVDVPDYSSRQDRKLFKGGKVGRMVYGPGAARFFPVLHAGTILQVGKNAGSGCGRFEVELLDG